MPLEINYTSHTGPGHAGPARFPSDSIGGFATTTPWPGGVALDLFGIASSSDVAANRNDYRCLFVYNPDPVTAAAVRVSVDPFTGGGFVAVGADPRPVSKLDALAPQAVETSSGYLAPPAVSFTTPATYAAGVALGDLPQNYGRAVWFRRTPTASADAAAEMCDVTLGTAAGPVWTRRIVWATEAAAAPTAPPAPLQPAVFVPTPSPFTRVVADFLTDGGSRIMWEIDATLQDPGPYDFQLQVSQSGGPNADDWTDVGPPVLDAPYLVDPGARLWGMSATTNYRVVLTTGTGAYVSPVTNVYGALGPRDWLNVRELVRKEKLMLREFVGNSGYLLKAKRYGVRCTCTNATTGERQNSTCTTCYGVGIVGGYHPPIPVVFAVLDNEGALESVQYNENLGTMRPVTVTGRMVADTPIVHQDAWVSASGDDARYYVGSVTEAASVQGCPVVYQVELHQVPKSDVLHRLPFTRPANDPRYWKVEQTLNL